MHMPGEFFYLETSEHFNKCASYEKNLSNKNLLFLKWKSDSTKTNFKQRIATIINIRIALVEKPIFCLSLTLRIFLCIQN